MAELVTLVTALVVLASAVTTAVMTWRVRQRVEQTQADVREVHVMVNSQRDTMMARLDQLAAALMESGTAVPPAPLPSEETA